MKPFFFSVQLELMKLFLSPMECRAVYSLLQQAELDYSYCSLVRLKTATLFCAAGNFQT